MQARKTDPEIVTSRHP